jgi:ubiquinol oxidase
MTELANHTEIARRHEAHGLSDQIALGITKFLRFFADTFFAKRYGHRAIVLETVAAVPGMVGGMMNHLKSLRRMREDEGWIHELLEEAENERMHLMAFVALFKPTWFERLLVLFAQGAFWNFYFLLYLFAPRTAHRTVGYFEEEAVISYTGFLEQIDAGHIENVPAPKLAIDYWKASRREPRLCREAGLRPRQGPQAWRGRGEPAGKSGAGATGGLTRDFSGLRTLLACPIDRRRRGRGLVQRPACAGGRIQCIGEPKRQAFGAGEGNHRGIVGAPFQRRGGEAKAGAAGLGFEAGAQRPVGGNAAGDDEGALAGDIRNHLHRTG